MNKFTVIHVPSDAARVSEVMGTKRKFWFQDNELGSCLFKFSRQNTGEDWAEKIAAELCLAIGLPCARQELGAWEGQRGTISPEFLMPNEELVHGNDILNGLVPTYPREKKYNVSEHTLATVLPVFSDLDIQMPLRWKSPPLIKRTTMNTLFLAWQDPISRSWFPIGKLTYDDQRYHFGYIHGALLAQQQANFRPLLAFPNLNQSYSSIELFPPFANRLLNRSRQEYPEFIDWLNLTPESHGDPYSIDPITLLGRSGGKRVTDHFEVFPFPNLTTAGEYEIYFFTHGLRHFPTHSQQRATECTVGEELLLVHDMQNQHDASALMLQTFDRHTLGFCPRYLAKDFFKLVCATPQAIKVVVEKVNPAPVPLQFRLLCKLTAQYEQGFQPFSSVEYQLIMPSKQSSHENLQSVNRTAITTSVL